MRNVFDRKDFKRTLRTSVAFIPRVHYFTKCVLFKLALERKYFRHISHRYKFPSERVCMFTSKLSFMENDFRQIFHSNVFSGPGSRVHFHTFKYKKNDFWHVPYFPLAPMTFLRYTTFTCVYALSSIRRKQFQIFRVHTRILQCSLECAFSSDWL